MINTYPKSSCLQCLYREPLEVTAQHLIVRTRQVGRRRSWTYHGQIQSHMSLVWRFHNWYGSLLYTTCRSRESRVSVIQTRPPTTSEQHWRSGRSLSPVPVRCLTLQSPSFSATRRDFCKVHMKTRHVASSHSSEADGWGLWCYWNCKSPLLVNPGFTPLIWTNMPQHHPMIVSSWLSSLRCRCRHRPGRRTCVLPGLSVEISGSTASHPFYFLPPAASAALRASAAACFSLILAARASLSRCISLPVLVFFDFCSSIGQTMQSAGPVKSMDVTCCSPSPDSIGLDLGPSLRSPCDYYYYYYYSPRQSSLSNRSCRRLLSCLSRRTCAAWALRFFSLAFSRWFPRAIFWFSPWYSALRGRG